MTENNTENNCQPCEASSVKIAGMILSFFDRHVSLAKPLFKSLGYAIMISSVGFSAYMIYYLTK